MDGVNIQQGIWLPNQEIYYSLTEPPKEGYFDIVLEISDGLSSAISDSVTVNFLNIAPIVDHPEDIIMNYGEFEYIIWTITDNAIKSSAKYSIYRNDILIIRESWTDPTEVQYNLRLENVGTLTFDLIVDDGYGSISTDQVIVTVTNSLPILTHPKNITMYQHSSQWLIWTVADGSLAGNPTYEILRDGTSILNNTWKSGDQIKIDLSSLAPNIYVYRLMVNEGVYQVTDDVSVQVLPNAIPSLIRITNNNLQISSSTNLSWVVSDLNIFNATYVITMNAKVVKTGDWVTGDIISITTGNLQNGTYLYELSVFDGLGSSNQSTITVIVSIIPEPEPEPEPPEDQPPDLTVMYVILIGSTVSIGGAYGIYIILQKFISSKTTLPTPAIPQKNVAKPITPRKCDFGQQMVRGQCVPIRKKNI